MDRPLLSSDREGVPSWEARTEHLSSYNKPTVLQRFPTLSAPLVISFRLLASDVRNHRGKVDCGDGL
ncbi:Hypothetical protein NTJ_13937 [Nesidiocoris tenuis]|uniref:Uncharacterized protein n=1 Tax=Nesidiocoris tenuis TaxID=355587 RepID=A0ABN7B9Q4_9HEMI|nr:Hypothetical protein NTJ_13937 [Nesidiocoris tenuis]